MVAARDVLRCVVVDDNPEFVSVAAGLLQPDGVTVVGVAASGAEAIERCAELRPDVVLVDVDLGEENGFAVAELLHRDALVKPPAVIMISSRAERDVVEMVSASGAVGFVSKQSLSGGTIRGLAQARKAVDSASPLIERPRK